MRKVACVKKKLNNAGMTLVELIVAIAIITVAIIPLMFGFIFVLKNNMRAREIQQTTVLAHTVMENCKAFPVADIPLKVTGGNFLNGVSAANGHLHPSADIIYLDDAPVGERKFDVMLTLKAHNKPDGTVSVSSLLDYTEMNAYNDAVFQSQTSTSTATPPVAASEVDDLAYFNMIKALRDKAYECANALHIEDFNVSLSSIDMSFRTGEINAGVAYNLERDITIQATSDAAADYVSVTYKYAYKLSEDLNVEYLKPDGSYGVITVGSTELMSDSTWESANTYTFQIYNSTETKSHEAKLENVYFFYYPAYKADGDDVVAFDITVDKITINNNLSDSRGLNVYLFKQLNPTIGEHNTTIADANYAPHIYGTGGAINLYHNLFENIGSTGSGNSWDMAMLHHSGNVSTLGTAETLIKKSSKSLIFDIKVEVFPEGTYNEVSNSMDSTVEPITTLEGTVLNK